MAIHQKTKKSTLYLTNLFLLGFLIFGSLLSISCSSDDENIVIEKSEETDDTNTPAENPDITYNLNVTQPNILLIIADDMGMDATPYATQLNSVKPTMPHLEKLQEQGIRFSNAWAYPRCTPTRGSILTGKHGVSTGLLSPSDVIDSSETTLQSYINNNSNTYATAIMGKWHLSKTSRNIENMGIDMYKGNTGGGLTDYYNWTLHEDGNTSEVTNYYGTTAYTDYAIDWIQAQTKPWFCWVAYNAAHSTFHTPTNSDLYTHTGNTTFDMYLQMLEAMDTEMGRLIASIPKDELANTTIIFIGDNGTPSQIVQAPFERAKAKGSLFNGGINVPLIVAGANVSRQNETEDALVQASDLFATIADLCGANKPNIYESISFKPILTQKTTHTRLYNFTEGLANGPAFGGYTVRNNKYKYIYNEDAQTHYLFDVTTDYAENNNLYDGTLTTEQQNAVSMLQAEATRIKGL